MRVVFAGTPPFAARALEALLDAGHAVPLVLTQPDRPAGRGMRLTASAVATLAAERGLSLHKPASLRNEESRDPIRAARPDVMVVAAYGLILPQGALDIPALGCLNIHASLLPRWRGAAPIQRAILAGDARTGVGIMRMDAGLDTGPVLLEKTARIEADDTAGSLTLRLADIGAEALVEVLTNLNRYPPTPQEVSGITYAAKISKEEARIDWSQPAVAIDRQIRAYNPAPGAETTLGGQGLKIWKARVEAGEGLPGSVLDAPEGELLIACGEGCLNVGELQRAGSRRMGVPEYLRGTALKVGTRFGVE